MRGVRQALCALEQVRSDESFRRLPVICLIFLFPVLTFSGKPRINTNKGNAFERKKEGKEGEGKEGGRDRAEGRM